MSQIEKIKLKKEKRFTRENDEDFDLLCKCWYSVYGERETDHDRRSFLDKESDVDIDYKSYFRFFELLVKIKFKEKGVNL